MQSLSPVKKQTFSCPAEILDEPFSAGVGEREVVLLNMNISQIAQLYCGQLIIRTSAKSKRGCLGYLKIFLQLL